MIQMQSLLLAFALGGSTSPSAPRLDELLAAGDPASPVHLVLYVSLDDEGQRALVTSLHREAEAGRLRGKVRVSLRPLSARPDDPVARALIAAAMQGRLGPYVEALREGARPFREPDLQCAADRAGLDADSFGLALRNRRTELLLQELQGACARDGVGAGPAAYVGSRRLRCALTCEELVAALLVEHDRAANVRTER